MKLITEGDINPYYAQTLCMIFFPGAKFGADGADDPNTPTVTIRVTEIEGAARGTASIRIGDHCAESTRKFDYRPGMTAERVRKIAAGAAMLAAGEKFFGYRPSWGILTGVRPAKVATELLASGLTPGRARDALRRQYLLTPKKAALAVEVALREQKLIGEVSPRDCSVYVSIPFCPSRCAYCSFVSYTSPRLLSLIPEYLIRLCDDLEHTFAQIRRLGLRVRTVYIGGGTPTILDPAQLEMLLSTIARGVDIASLEELTLESGRPDTITREKMQVAADYGVTRVSVNPQSLDTAVLDRIGRAHSVDEFFAAFDAARQAGIPQINTDLIAGLPEDNFLKFSRTFDRVLELAPDNITVHTFCIKKAADILREGSGVYSLRGGDAGQCVDYSQIKAQEAGYFPYYMYRQKNTVGNFENVGFARDGAEGRYNVYMMEEIHSIFAVGAGAVTKMVHVRPKNPADTKIIRLAPPKYPYEYLRSDHRAEHEARIDAFYESEILD
ncbi:MAG: coproporphyrinogen dehydrogenase HemZ [Clostridia bacterium]|nr:coproporphyrinogen dehydrogenase HemZ [Clostridia bacterium]